MEGVEKCCTKCGKFYPATLEFWHKYKGSINQLRAYCRICCNLACKEYYNNNKEKFNRAVKEWQKKNKEKHREYDKKWREKNLESVRLTWQRRRARKKLLPDTLTVQQIDFLKEYFNNKCAICGSTTKLELDHWLPLTNVNCLGTVAENILLLCRQCNRAKRNVPPQQWLMQKFNGYFAMYIWIKVCNYFKNVVKKGNL